MSSLEKVSRIVPTEVLLNDGHTMPPIAFGTFSKINELSTLRTTVINAIEAGYRHFDTTPLYFNEVQIGEAVRDVTERGIVTHEDLFITTKLDTFPDRSAVVPAVKRSLQRLQLDYVDLYLIHIPFDMLAGKEINYVDIWKGMEDVKLLGLARSIGISNFNCSQINDILATCSIRPAVIQIEASPTFTNLDLVAYCQSQQIHVTAFSPFGFLVARPFRNVSMAIDFDNPILVKIAGKHNKTPSQVVLRYLIDRGITPISESFKREYMTLNINILDFSLSQEEVEIINELNQNEAVYDFNNLDNLYKYFFDMNMEEVFRTVNKM